MFKAASIISALSLTLAAALPAKATEQVKRENQIVKAEAGNPAFHADVVAVETKRSTGSIIAADAIGGAVAGTAVAGGVVLYRRYVENGDRGQWGNWQRDLAIGAGIGLAVGLVVGVVDASSNADRVPNGPLADQREIGFSASTPVYGKRF